MNLVDNTRRSTEWIAQLDMGQKLIRRYSLLTAVALQGALLGQVTSYYPLATEPSWVETSVDESFLDGNTTSSTQTNLTGFDGSKYIIPIIPGFRGGTPIGVTSHSDGGDFGDPFDTFGKTDETVDETGITLWKTLVGSLGGGSGQGAASLIFEGTTTYATIGPQGTTSDGVVLYRRKATIGEIVGTRYRQNYESISSNKELDIDMRILSTTIIDYRSVYAGTSMVPGLYPGSDPVLVTDPYNALVRVSESTLTGTTESFVIAEDGSETSFGSNEIGPTTLTSIEWTVKGIGVVRLLIASGGWLDEIVSRSLFNNGSNVVGVISLEELIPTSDLFSEILRSSGGNLTDAADTILTDVGQEIILWPIPEEREVVYLADPTSQLADAAKNAGLTGDDLTPEAIPMNDGIPNILKFAFNMDLSNADTHTLSNEGSSGLPAVAILKDGTDRILQIDYIRRKNAGLIYTPVYSTSLNPQSFVTVTGIETVTPVNDSLDRVCVEMPIDFSDTNAYFSKVKVEY